MNKGVLFFAYNIRQVDYLRLSVLAARLAKKNLAVPVSLITDESTISWAKQSGIYDQVIDTFEHVILDEVGYDSNYRLLHDGDIKDKIPFKNSSRSKAWDLTPYDRTLLIDSDFLIFSDNLSNYWEIDEDFLISSCIRDINDTDRMQHHDRYISDTGIKLLWATTVMFTKNQNSKMIFDFVKHVQENYSKYAEIYRYDDRVYRNDIAFSIAYHSFSGFVASKDYFLPSVLSAIDKDILMSVDRGKLKFLINTLNQNNYTATSLSDIDIHVMNKQSIIRNYNSLMEIA